MSLKLIAIIISVIAVAGILFSSQKSYDNKLIIPQNAAPLAKVSEVRSSEGTMKLIMTTKENLDGTVLYSFSISDPSSKTTPLFAKRVAKGEEMALPQNSWSPNGKYVFIEDRRGLVVDYLVFKTSGEAFTNGQKYLNATALFNEKVKNYNLKAITGWDDPVLMHVLTFKGPPFWFDITTQSFIQLVR